MDNPWIVTMRSNPQARMRLFCFPFAGGAASTFRAWPQDLPDTVEVCAVQLPGRETRIRERPFDSAEALVQALAPALFPAFRKPYALLGHSLGALLAFETARHLRRLHCPSPSWLFVSGRYAPQMPSPNPPIHDLPGPQFIEALRGYNGTPEDVLRHEELLQLFVPILRADFAVNYNYQFSGHEPFEFPISAAGARDDHKVPLDSLQGWGEHTSGQFKMRVFDGDHFFIIKSRAAYLQAVSEDLSELLAKT